MAENWTCSVQVNCAVYHDAAQFGPMTGAVYLPWCSITPEGIFRWIIIMLYLRRYRKTGRVGYTPITFDERVTFWLQCAQSLPCACVFAALRAGAIA